MLKWFAQFRAVALQSKLQWFFFLLFLFFSVNYVWSKFGWWKISVFGKEYVSQLIYIKSSGISNQFGYLELAIRETDKVDWYTFIRTTTRATVSGATVDPRQTKYLHPKHQAIQNFP